MSRRGILLVVGVLVVVVMLVCLLRLKRQSAGAPPPVDLTRHDGQTIDFSSGKPVVKSAPADQAALDRALKDMAEATKDVTFAPTAPPAAPAPPPKT